MRFFAGADLDSDLCGQPDMIEKAYASGVPMGGRLSDVSAARPPRFLVSAMKDPGTPEHPGTDLQVVQVVKGWVDEQGRSHERVIDVAGDSDNGASVDENTCAPKGRGAAALCTVWTDPEYDPTQAAFYYVRVLENPTCRWSTLQCQAAGVNPFAASCEARALQATNAARDRGAVGDVYGKCCIDPATEPFYTPTIQERAWTSPIWIDPVAPDSDVAAASR